MFPCPSGHEIEQTILGLLPDEQLAAIQEHLLECATCVETANVLPATDTLVESLRVDADVYAAWSCPIPQVQKLIERFRLLGLGRAGRAGSADGSGEFDPRSSHGSGDAAPPATLDLPLGATLGNYLLLEKIGAGGMGQVFKARHRRMDRIVAIKVLSPRIAKDETAIARFEREVKAAAKLFHPNVVTALDADQADGIHFLVMEFVEGCDLSALVKRDGALPVNKAVDYVLQAAKGLEFAHSRGLIHRDVKPANMLLDGDGTVKILDLGLARFDPLFDDQLAPALDLTSSGTIMGTADYMAPEQALNTKRADARADIYALGCTLYYLIGDKPTFAGDTFIEKLIAHSEQPIPSLRELQPDVTEQLDAVFQMMVAKKVDDRYQTMSAVVADLQACVAVRAATGRSAQRAATSQSVVRPLPAASAGHFKNRKRAWLGAAGLSCLLVSAVVIVKLRTNADPLIVDVDRPSASKAIEAPTEVGVDRQTVSPASEARAATDVDRQAAERVLGVGGTLRVATTAGTQDVNQAEELPLEAFVIVHLTLDTNHRVTKQDLASLPTLASLENVNLTNTPEIDLSAFEHDRKLENLYLYQSGVTNADLVHVRRSHSIKRLSLGGTAIDDAGLLDVSELTQLISLDLRNTRVTDQGLAQLAKLKDLATLVVSGTKVTAAGVAKLQVALPQCAIEWDGAAK